VENEFYRLVRDYPTVAFNYRSFTEGPNTPDKGFKHLCVLEPYIGQVENWMPDIINQYESYICWNRKFMQNPAIKTKRYTVKGSVFCNHVVVLNNHLNYDERIPGMCVLNKLYYTGKEGDILMEREKAVSELFNTTNFAIHVFAPTPWGGRCYQGPDGSPIHHSHPVQLERISKYRFVLCFESSYHEMWSYDFMTERLFNAFKAKTVPIYWGCWNIEDWVPTNLFIDMRKFASYADLGEYMDDMSKQQWIDMTEAAFEWEKTCDIGSMQALDSILTGLTT
jgi:hypothetical protein